MQLPTSNKNKYESLVLPNGIKVLLVSNDEYTYGSAAVSVEAGSFYENEAFKGSAHFLEHMLFMGTEKYPNEDHFTNLVSKFGGEYNAYTADELTLYFFGVPVVNFDEVLDVFLQFCISPLFRKDAIEREVEAVHSEYTISLNNKYFCEAALLGEFRDKEKTHFGRFNCGNNETLHKEGIYEEMKNFYKNYYSADKLSLVISGPFSIDELKKKAKIFEAVQRKDVLSYTPSVYDSCFDSRYKGAFIKSKPIDGVSSLGIYFFIPSLISYPKENALMLFIHGLQKKSKNSLLSNLIRDGLGNSVDLSVDSTLGYSLINISVALTDKGVNNVKAVEDLVYETILGLDLSETLYNLLGKRSRVDFDYMDELGQVSLTTVLAERLRFYQVEDLLSHNYLALKYNEDLFKKIHKIFKNRREWLSILYTPEGEFNSVEYYYNIPYTITNEKLYEDTDKTAMRSSDIISPNEIKKVISNFSLLDNHRQPNIFFNRHFFTNFNVNGVDVDLVFNKSFSQPRILYTFSLKNEDIVKCNAYYNVLLKMISFKLNEDSFNEIENGRIDIDLNVTPTEILFHVNGYSSTCFLHIVNQFFKMLNNIPEETFEIFRKNLIDDLTEFTMASPHACIGYNFLLSRIEGSTTVSDQITQLGTMKYSDLPLNRSYKVKLYAVGNIEEEVIKTFVKNTSFPEQQNFEFKKSEIRVSSFKSNTKINTGLAHHYPVKKVDASKAMLLGQVLGNHFFELLRTQETLGYNVRLGFHTVNNEFFIKLFLQSAKSAEFIRERFNKFMQVDAPEFIKKLKESEIDQFKQGLISKLKVPSTSLVSLSNEVITQDTSFNDYRFYEEIIDSLDGISKEDISNFNFLGEHFEIFSIKKE